MNTENYNELQEAYVDGSIAALDSFGMSLRVLLSKEDDKSAIKLTDLILLIEDMKKLTRRIGETMKL